MWYLDGDRQEGRGNKWSLGGRGPILKVRARLAAGGTDRAHRIAALAILLIALAGLGVGVALGFRQLGAWLFAHNPRFVIQPGGLDLQSSGRLQAAHLQDYAGLAEGQNLFALDLEKIRKTLLAVPLIKSAEVRRMLPGTLRVRVSERVPVARLASGAGFQFAVDRDGVVLGPSGRAATLPLITGVTEPGLSPGTLIAAPAFLDALEAVEFAESAGLSRIFRIARVDISHEEYLDVLLTSGTRVLLGRVDVRTRLNNLSNMLQEAARKGQRHSMIDLTMDVNIPATLAER